MSNFKVKILPGGKITIPGPIRKRLNYKVGHELILRLNADTITLDCLRKDLKAYQTQIKNRLQEQIVDIPSSEPKIVCKIHESISNQN